MNIMSLVCSLNDDAVSGGNLQGSFGLIERHGSLSQWPQVIGVAPDANEDTRDGKGVVLW